MLVPSRIFNHMLNWAVGPTPIEMESYDASPSNMRSILNGPSYLYVDSMMEFMASARRFLVIVAPRDLDSALNIFVMYLLFWKHNCFLEELIISYRKKRLRLQTI